MHPFKRIKRSRGPSESSRMAVAADFEPIKLEIRNFDFSGRHFISSWVVISIYYRPFWAPFPRPPINTSPPPFARLLVLLV